MQFSELFALTMRGCQLSSCASLKILTHVKIYIGHSADDVGLLLMVNSESLRVFSKLVPRMHTGNISL